MSKSEMLMNGCWESYPFKIEMLARKPKNQGELRAEDAEKLEGELVSVEYGSVESGEWIRLYCIVDSDKRVAACRYQLFGPPVLRAAADMAALLCRNKTAAEIEKIDYRNLEYFLRDHPSNPALPSNRNYIVNFVVNALERMVDKLEGREREESVQVCKCAGVDLLTIEKAIRDYDIDSIGGIGDYTKAGVLCGRCISHSSNAPAREHYLEDILKKVRKELLEEGKAKSDIPDKPFSQMNLEEKRAAIEATIDEYIRAMLVMDGGDMEIIDIKENGVNTDLYIRYLGACSGCASASTGTLFAIEGILKQKLDPNLRVLPL